MHQSRALEQLCQAVPDKCLPGTILRQRGKGPLRVQDDDVAWLKSLIACRGEKAEARAA